MSKTKGQSMTFDEAKEILERAELFAELCNEYGVEVKEGTGRIMIDGKDIDIVKDVFPRQEIDACKHCSNNPNNGGSGVCHCILGNPVIY